MGATEIECFGGNVKYRIGMQNQSLAEIFEKMEAVKLPLTISNYSISQTSLEQVFIHFAAEGQRAELEAEVRLKGVTDPEARHLLQGQADANVGVQVGIPGPVIVTTGSA